MGATYWSMTRYVAPIWLISLEDKVISRPQVLQAFLSFYQKPAYLEIGVQNGATFHALHAGSKTAVDPRFNFRMKTGITVLPISRFPATITSRNSIA